MQLVKTEQQQHIESGFRQVELLQYQRRKHFSYFIFEK